MFTSSLKSRSKAAYRYFLGALLILSLLLTSCGGLSPAQPTETPVPTSTPAPTPSPTPNAITPDQNLAALITAADDGDTIHLSPGVFNLAQGLTIDKSLTLIGAGSSQTTITADLPTADIAAMINFSGSGTLTLQGMRVEYIGSDPAAIIYANAGALGLDDCVLTGATVSASGSQLGAIQLAENAVALIRNSQILGSLDRLDPKDPDKIPGGIFISGKTQLTLENVVITDSYLGIYAYGDAVMTVSKSTFANMYAAVGLLENASATLTGNNIVRSKGAQIALFDYAKLSAFENTLDNLDGSIGFQVTEDAYAHLEKNKINSGLSGIIFSDNATGEVFANEITAVINVGIFVQDEASPVIDSNILTGCNIGITFEGNSTGSVVNNNISNGEIGISIDSPASPSVVGNTLQGWLMALMSDPEDWLTKLDVRDNSLTDGEPEIIIVDAPGDDLETWTGTIESLPAGSQFDDQFTSDTLEQKSCGIDGISDAVNQLIAIFRDSGKMVTIQGTISTDVPDLNGCQIRVTKVEEE